MKLKPDLCMPTEEVVGKAIDTLNSVLDGKPIPQEQVTAAAALLTAYGNLRPLDNRKFFYESKLDAVRTLS